jgi:hypothetical protein
MKKITILTIIGLLITNSTFAQCAMCRATVESTMSNGRNLVASGLNTGILYLFVAPYLLAFIVWYFWQKSSKKNEVYRLSIQQKVKKALTNPI